MVGVAAVTLPGPVIVGALAVVAAVVGAAFVVVFFKGLGVAFGVAFAVAFGVAFAVAFAVAFGAVFAVAFAVAFGVAFALALGFSLGFSFDLGFAFGVTGCACAFPVLVLVPVWPPARACATLGNSVPSMMMTAAKAMTHFMMPPDQTCVDPV
jgi:hypothetical protein